LSATAAQVFGPNTVNPGFTTTGEKTLLTMSTTLAAGGRNVILFSYMENFAFGTGGARGVLRIKKGTSIIYETKITEVLNFGGTQARPKLVIAVDGTPSGNDVYVATLNITTAGSATGSIHVQAIVIKAGDAVWGYNTTGVNIASGATATVTSISTNYSSGSKVAIIGAIYGGRSTGTGRDYMGIGSNRLKSGGTVVASNEFNASSYSLDYINSWVSLQYLETTSTSSQTYRLEVSNGGEVQVTMYGIIVAFTVGDGAFLDTASVSLTSGSQVTVGSLSTTLAGDVVAIGLATDNFTGTGDTKGFDPGDVVLQRDNSVTGQIANQVSWHVVSNIWPGTLPLFRIDTNVANPSYQIKMTARVTNLSGEAKILAFSLFAGVAIKKVFGETLQLLENIILRRGRFRLISENILISEAPNRFRSLFRYIIEQINLIESSILSRIWIRVRDETINLVDVFQRAMNKFRHALEGLNIFESASASKGNVLPISEMVRVSEIVTGVRKMFREVVEIINLNEVLSISHVIVRVFGEFVNLLENVIRSRILNRVVNEAERLFESFVSALGKVFGIVENVRVLESTLASRMRVRISDELVRLSEVFSKSISIVKPIIEQVRLSETFKALSNKFRSVVESVRIDEFLSLASGKFRSFMEPVRIGEVFNSFRDIVRQVVEVVNIGEASSRLSNLFRSVVESVRIGEFVREVRNMFIRVLEDVNVIESITSSRILVRVRDELIEVGELFSSFIGRVKVVVENVWIIEILSLSTFKIYIKRLKSMLVGSSKGGEI
jgi:hypothetical protein